MENYTQIYRSVLEKLKNNKISTVDKNGIKVNQLTIFEEIIIRNINNLDTIALEIVGDGTKLTYKEFFKEVEKYMNSYKNLGLKEHDVVSLCLPVSIEFICSYYALTTLGITVNALNIMFLLSNGAKPYLDERCSDVFICDENYFKILQSKNVFENSNVNNIIITGDASYNHLNSDSNKIVMPDSNINNVNIYSFNEFLNDSKNVNKLNAVDYNESRISTLNYTSGTTGMPKCMGHSDLAPLYLIAEHDLIARDEYAKDRTLLTIPLQHPTGLFYSMVFQMAQGKTLVLEPKYDKTLFAQDIINNKINHAVQAKPFYAQLVQDRADGKLKPGDFELFRNAYSGGEGIPYSTCKIINDTLHYAGCPNDIILGYGRSEEGSSTMVPYGIEGRNNTIGVPLPGNKAKIVDAKTLEDIPQVPGAKGEILVNTPVSPINHCYLSPYNKNGMSDNSIVDENGVRWARAEDIAELVEMPDGSLSFLVLGRAQDRVHKNDIDYYLFDIKEMISDIKGIQECEVLSTKVDDEEKITAHIVLKDEFLNNTEEIIREVYNKTPMIDGVKFHERFGINATSGKCDREAMKQELDNFYVLNKNGLINNINFGSEDKKLVLKK